MPKTLFLVAFGGMFGCVARFLFSHFLSKSVSLAFPLATFLINVIGCLLIGMFWALSQKYEWFSVDMRFLLMTGFCGGFTTFSAFALENLQLLQNQQYATFFLYAFASVALGILATALGFWSFR